VVHKISYSQTFGKHIQTQTDNHASRTE